MSSARRLHRGRYMRQFLGVFVLLCGLSASAEAVTLRDLVDLSKQGLSDDLLIALVDAEQSVFHLTAAEVRSLKEQGLSDRLLIHLLQTPAIHRAPEPKLHLAHTPSARSAPPPLERVVIVDRVEHVAIPVYVPVAVRATRDRDDDRDDGSSAPRVYWGYGGQLRPGSWKER